jgi:hypothetical protein
MIISMATPFLDNARNSIEQLLVSSSVVAGGLVGGVVMLGGLSRMPYLKKLFELLVLAPVSSFIDGRITASVDAKLREKVSEAVRLELTTVNAAIDQINEAVNNVGPGVDPLKTRVAKIIATQHEMKESQSEIKGELGIMKSMLTQLVANNGGNNE